MIRRVARLAASASVFAFALAPAQTAPGLDVTNYVEVGDSVSEMLDTSGLAFSTMLMDPGVAQEELRGTSFNGPAPARPSRAQLFRKMCPGGGHVEIEVFDADASGDLSAHDRFRLKFGACAIDGDVVGGRSEFVVAAHRFEGTTEVTELDFRFDALSSRVTRWTGSARAVLRSDLQRGTESYQVTYRNLLVTRGLHTMHWNFGVDMVRPPFGEQVASVKGEMTVDDLPLTLHQDEPFVIAVADGHPRSGQVTARDPGGARLQIEAQRRRYAYRFFRAGNSGETAESASQSRPYGTR